MANRDPLADWQALSQQYWQGLTELGQKFITPAAPPPATPWAEGLDQWTRLFAGGQPGATTQQNVFEQLLAQGKTYVGMLEELFKSGAASTQQHLDLAALAKSSLEQFRQSQPWLQGLGDYGKWFDPEALEKWLGNFGGDAHSWLHTPAFGFHRQQQERFQRLQSNLLDYRTEIQRYHALINKALEGGIRRMESKLAEHAEPGRQLKSLKAVYDLWIDALEESYAEVALSSEFREVYGALVNAQMKVKAGIQAEVEKATGELGMPTRRELDGVHRKLVAVRSQLREVDAAAIDDLRSEVASLKAQLAAMQQVHTTASAAVAPAPTKTAVSKSAAKPAAPPRPAAKAAGKTPAKGKSAARVFPSRKPR